MSVVQNALREHSPLFVTQLAARTQLPISDVEHALDSASPEVLVIGHSSPDRHIEADLRIAVLVEGGDVESAVRSADALWREWLSRLLQSHRCA